MSSIYSVSRLTSLIRENIETAFPYVWVQGQVTNCSRAASGHIYFSLRDEDASLSCAWFKGRQKADSFDPLTGEVYEGGPRPSLAAGIEDGMDVICAGRLEVYAPRGAYQLKVEIAQAAGISRFQVEFEKLKAELQKKGYFDLSRKRPLPRHPGKIAVVTSAQGAAIHDFLRIASRRGFGAEIRIYPAPVQGDEAPAKLAAAIRAVNSDAWADVLVLIRGGGSVEDLWAFNTEAVTTAVYSSALPVVAGIGHEVDVSLADMTADMRAATPSHAAQLLWPEREEFRKELEALAVSLERAARARFERHETRLGALSAELAWRSPERLLSNWSERLSLAVERMRAAARRLPEAHLERLERLSAGLNAAPARLPRFLREIETLEHRLNFAGRQAIQAAGYRLERLEARLAGLDPHAPLERGYALVSRTDGTYVRSVNMVEKGERLSVLVKDGEIPVKVEGA